MTSGPAGCALNAPEELYLAVAQFNEEKWYECHETLEELWVGRTGELRDFYQGFLQLAVALYHWRHGNFKGAVSLLAKGGDCLGRVPDLCQGIDAARLAGEAAAFKAELERLGEERMAEIDPRLIPTVRLAAPEGRGERR